jgi:hypothetical protein
VKGRIDMTNKPFDEKERENQKGRKLDNPDLVKTEEESLFDMHEDMQTVDAIPVEELNQKVKDEKDKRHTKDTSASKREEPSRTLESFCFTYFLDRSSHFFH